jgi:hypothetical protein
VEQTNKQTNKQTCSNYNGIASTGPPPTSSNENGMAWPPENENGTKPQLKGRLRIPT